MPLTAQKNTHKSLGRYDRRGDERMPENGLGRPAPSLGCRTAIAAVPNPLEPKERLLATVNLRVDILESERKHHLISEAAFQAGRQLQRVLELRNRIVSGSANGGGDRLTGDQKASGMHQRLADLLDRTGGFLRFVDRELGMIDARLIRRVLGDRMSYAECASLQGKSGDRGARYISARFRDALEALAKAQEATGRDHGRGNQADRGGDS